MALCDSCIFYNKQYDELRQETIDTKNLNGGEHFCFMYQQEIPAAIWQHNADCEYFEKK